MLDLQVAVEKGQFLAQWDFVLVGALERQAEQIAQARNHAIGGLDVFVHQGGDRVERIEQEMRVELHLQRLKLCLGQPLLQFRGAQLALMKFPVIVDRMNHRHDDPIYQQVEKKRFRE